MRNSSTRARAPARGSLGILLTVSWGCALSTPDGAKGSEPLVQTLSGASLASVPVVERFLVSRELGVPLMDFWLIQGRLSKTAARQLSLGSPAEGTITSRRPLTGWRAQGGVVLAPGEVLEPGEAYSLAAVGLGVIADFTVAAESGPVLRPTSFTVQAGGWVGYCLAEGAWSWSPPGEHEWAVVLGSVVVGPEDRRVEVTTGLEGGTGGDRCVRLAVPTAGASLFIPPATVAGLSVDPTPLAVATAQGQSGVANDEDAAPELVLRSDVAFVDVPAGFSLLELSGAAEPATVHYRGDSATRLPLGALPPGRHRLHVTHVGLDGLSKFQEWEFTTERGSAYLVLSEVMSNPAGPEPENEWIEVQNIGRAPTSLAGYTLSDGAGTIQLPAVTLDAGATGVIVRSDFRPNPDLDALPDVAAVPIVVDEVTSGGLSNAGEALRLFAPDGEVGSSFPAQPGRSGQSVARRHPLSPDVGESFGYHAPPGSSPGRPNELVQ